MATIKTPLTIFLNYIITRELQYLGLEVLEVVEASMVAADIVEESVTETQLENVLKCQVEGVT